MDKAATTGTLFRRQAGKMASDKGAGKMRSQAPQAVLQPDTFRRFAATQGTASRCGPGGRQNQHTLIADERRCDPGIHPSACSLGPASRPDQVQWSCARPPSPAKVARCSSSRRTSKCWPAGRSLRQCRRAEVLPRRGGHASRERSVRQLIGRGLDADRLGPGKDGFFKTDDDAGSPTS